MTPIRWVSTRSRWRTKEESNALLDRWRNIGFGSFPNERVLWWRVFPQIHKLISLKHIFIDIFLTVPIKKKYTNWIFIRMLFRDYIKHVFICLCSFGSFRLLFAFDCYFQIARDKLSLFQHYKVIFSWPIRLKIKRFNRYFSRWFIIYNSNYIVFIWNRYLIDIGEFF